ncbi:MAG: Ig domain-containing protein [Planctomycetota bacterium]
MERTRVMIRRAGLEKLLPALLGMLLLLGSGCGGGGGGGGGGLPLAPGNLSYLFQVATYFSGVAIQPNTPSFTGGIPDEFTVAPALPAGLILDPTSGIISGTPQLITPVANYTVTATNAEGSSSVVITITINPQAPGNLTYSDPAPNYTVGVPIPPNLPSSTGGAVDGYTVAPPLPDGLLLDGATGIISGTPSTVTAAADHLVTAFNVTGSANVTLTITVNPPPPTNLSYSEPVAIYCGGVPITPNVPSSSGGPVDSYSIDPLLPAGLALDSLTGIISGTPTQVSPATDHTVTASNGSGSTTATLTIAVVLQPPCNLTYTELDVVYIPGQPITPNLPSSDCCPPEGYSVFPDLPLGLDLDPVTGVISGTPLNETPEDFYLVTASNQAGDASVELVIRVSRVFRFSVLDQTVPYSVSSGQVNPPPLGAGTFLAPCFLDENAANPGFPHAIQGLEMGVAHDGAVLEAVDALVGADLMVLNGGSGPDFFGPSFYPDGVTIGILFSLTLTELLFADVPQETVVIEYRSVPGALAGNTNGVITTITWADDIVPPPFPAIANLVVLDGATAIDPIFVDAMITLDPSLP